MYNVIFDKGFQNDIIHISHNDMDGFYCNYIVDMMEGFNIHHINTKRINDVVETTINAVQELHKNQPDTKFTILISDIGSINLDTLSEAMRIHNMADYVSAVYIVDHHKSAYTGKIVRFNMYRTMELNVVDSDDYIPIRYMFTTDGITSATLILSHLIKPDDYRKRKFIMTIAEMVSKYDTGHWGQWNTEYPDLEIRMNNDLYVRSEMAKSFTMMILNPEDVASLNVYPDDKFNGFIYDGLRKMLDSWLYRVIKISENKGNLNTKWLLSCAFNDTDFATEYNLKLRRDYKTFTERLESIDPSMVENNMVKVYMPEPYDNKFVLLKLPEGSDINRIKVIRNTDDFRFYNYSLFSKDYLDDPETETDCIFQLGYRPMIKRDESEQLIIAIRSNDQFSSYEFANINGGGGHPRASGCTVDVHTD